MRRREFLGALVGSHVLVLGVCAGFGLAVDFADSGGYVEDPVSGDACRGVDAGLNVPFDIQRFSSHLDRQTDILGVGMAFGVASVGSAREQVFRFRLAVGERDYCWPQQ